MVCPQPIMELVKGQARRFSTDLLEAHERGFISEPIPGMKATAFSEDPYYTPILKELIGFSARPLRSVERDFAIDSSGFGSRRYERWSDSAESESEETGGMARRFGRENQAPA
jgi:hypothetical protein